MKKLKSVEIRNKIIVKVFTFTLAIMLVIIIGGQLAACGNKSPSEETSPAIEETNNEKSIMDVGAYVETTVQQEDITTQGEIHEDDSIIICIDPGHGGGSDGTKQSYDGKLVLEKNLNNKIAASLKTYLEQYHHVKAIITPCADNDMSLEGRISYAVSNSADYFVSIHVNSRSTDEVDSSGCMVLMSCSRYQPDNIKVSSLYDIELTMARSIISRLNSIGIKIANDWNTENTGGILQRQSTIGETYPDGSITDYYGLIYNGIYAGIPTIIVEHAFLSNESDYRNFLSTDEKLDALGKADAEGIAEALLLQK